MGILNESERSRRRFWNSLDKAVDSPRRINEEWFSTIGEEASRAFAVHEIEILVDLTARLKIIKDIPTARIPSDTKDRVLAMYRTVRRGVIEVRSLHRGFNPVQEGMNAGNEEIRASTCNRVIDVFHPAIESMLTTGRLKGFDQFPELAARLMATSDQVNLQRATSYLNRLVANSDNPKIVQEAKGVLDITTPSLRRMESAFGPVQRICRSFERRQQRGSGS